MREKRELPGASIAAAPGRKPQRRMNYRECGETGNLPSRGPIRRPSDSERSEEGMNRNYQDPTRSCRVIILECGEVGYRKIGIVSKIFQQNLEKIQVPHKQ